MKVVVAAPLSGIGQVCLKYCKLLGVEPSGLGEDFTGQDVFFFCLPIPHHLEAMKRIKDTAKSYRFMTVCETETVSPEYGKLFKISRKFWVPSEFAKNILERQFKEARITVFRHWVPPRIHKAGTLGLPSPRPYIFYTIGNAADPRKQMLRIVGTFLSLALPNSHLIIKATCREPVDWKIPGITVINGLVDDNVMQMIHNTGDCYVSFSNSEGVGMGAVEAAMNNKPVIMQDYGGCSEYVVTPFLVPCGLKRIGYTDFLFAPDMIWGDPDIGELARCMREVYSKGLRTWNHEHTHKLMARDNFFGDGGF